MKDWWIYRKTGVPHDEIARLPDPPSWRQFGKEVPETDYVTPHMTKQEEERLKTRAFGFQINDDEIDVINAALYLRRPLLVTGKPGCGKSTLASAVAYELQLGPVLHWPITTRVTLQNGLYHYDAIGRLQQASLALQASKVEQNRNEPDIGQFIRLGPLGTALLPSRYPRVLLIDEIDKSDIDLPNDLLNIFEEGRYEIPELIRISKQYKRVPVMPHDASAEADRVFIDSGQVSCTAFPFIVLTSNEEREFPPAFLRRCLRLQMEPPNEERLTKIVEARLGSEVLPQAEKLITDFIKLRASGDQATDQLLNAVYLVTRPDISKSETQVLLKTVLRSLTSAGSEEV